MQRIGAGRFEHLGDLTVLFHRGQLVVLADFLVVFLDGVDQNLNREVLSAFLFDALNDLAEEAGAVFKGLGTVLVGTGVAVAGKEGLADVVAGGIDLHTVDALALKVFRRVDEGLLQKLDLVKVHLVRSGALELRGSGSVKTGEGRAHEGELIAAVAALGMDGFGKLGQIAGFTVIDLVMRGEGGVEIDEVFNPDQFHTAAGPVGVLGDDVLLGLGGEVSGTGSGFDKAVFNGQTAELPGLEENAGAHVGGIIPAEDLALLRVEQRGCGLLGRGKGDLGAFGSFGRGLGSGADDAHGGDACRTGGDALQKAASGQSCCHVVILLKSNNIVHGAAGSLRREPAASDGLRDQTAL